MKVLFVTRECYPYKISNCIRAIVEKRKYEEMTLYFSAESDRRSQWRVEIHGMGK